MNPFPSFGDIASSSAPSFVWLYNEVSTVIYLVVGIIAAVVAIALLMRLVQHHD